MGGSQTFGFWGWFFKIGVVLVYHTVCFSTVSNALKCSLLLVPHPTLPSKYPVTVVHWVLPPPSPNTCIFSFHSFVMSVLGLVWVCLCLFPYFLIAHKWMKLFNTCFSPFDLFYLTSSVSTNVIANVNISTFVIAE